MPTLKSIIEKKNKRLEAIPIEFIGAVEKSQIKIFKNVLKLIDKLQRKGGKIAVTGKNFAIIAEISNGLQDAVFDTTYLKSLEAFASEFPAQAKINNSYFKAAFADFSDKTIFKSILKASQKQTINLLSTDAVQQVFATPLTEVLNSAVATNQSFDGLVDTLSDFVLGTDEIDAKLLRHVKQVAHDGFAVADRQYTQIVAEDLGIEWYLYSGATVRDTRVFCQQRANQYFHKKEVERWGTTPSQWQGRRAGTNSSTIFSFLGGWNCGHSILPAGINQVPRNVIERNISNGNFEEKEEKENK